MFVGAKLLTGSSGTLPTHAAGDLIVIMAVKWSSSSPTPSVPSGWTSVHSSTSTYRRVVAWRVATSSGTSSGTWSGAEALYVGIWRDFDAVGAANSAASSSNGAGAPALTLAQPGLSVVALLGSRDGAAPNLPAGMVERLRATGTGVYDLYADTGSAVSSWAAQSGNFEAVAVVELVSPVTATLTTSWEVAGYVTGTLATSWEVDQLTVTGTLDTSWQVQHYVTDTLTMSWVVASSANWWENIRANDFRDALLAPNREVGARAELVFIDGQPATYLTPDGRPISIDFDRVQVEYSGEQTESYRATFVTTDPDWVPNGPGHPLDPRSQYAIRIWWRLHTPTGWTELPLCTVRPDNPQVRDAGTVEVSWTGRDMLSIAKGAGYGGQVIDVGGLTVGAALERLFWTISQRQPLRIADTTATLPRVYQLGSETVDEDWTRIADTAGWTVRSDREGTIVCGPPPDPRSIARTLQEGPGCPVTVLGRDISSVTYNRVVVRSSSHEVDPPVWGVAEDDDAGSPTWIGAGVIRELAIDSDEVTTTQACRSMARMHLGKYLRPTEAISVTIPADPTLSYRDRVVLGRAKSAVGGEYRVSKWVMDIPVRGQAPGLMTVTMMREAIR